MSPEVPEFPEFPEFSPQGGPPRCTGGFLTPQIDGRERKHTENLGQILTKNGVIFDQILPGPDKIPEIPENFCPGNFPEFTCFFDYIRTLL